MGKTQRHLRLYTVHYKTAGGLCQVPFGTNIPFRCNFPLSALYIRKKILDGARDTVYNKLSAEIGG